MKAQVLTKPVARLATDKEAASAAWLTGRATRFTLLDPPMTVVVNGITYQIPAGYVSDLASIPWFLWWKYPPNYEPSYVAAWWHDRCYSHWYKEHLYEEYNNKGEITCSVWRNGVSKEFADNGFRELMLACGASRFTAGLFHLAVSTFGRGGW